MSDQKIEAAAAQYRATYDTALAELQSRVWGGNLHLGLFDRPGEALLPAQMRANRHMAAAADLEPRKMVIEAACGVGGTARFLALWGTEIFQYFSADRLQMLRILSELSKALSSSESCT